MSGRIYVGRLSYQVRERDIEKFFKGYGRIVDVLLKNGYGFVVSESLHPSFLFSDSVLIALMQCIYLWFLLQEFDDYRDADDAVYELNGKELCGERYAYCIYLTDFSLIKTSGS